MTPLRGMTEAAPIVTCHSSSMRSEVMRPRGAHHR
jgi:hypothetical protein